MICALCAMPRAAAGAYLAALPSLLRQGEKKQSWRVYLADALQAIAENTAVPAALYSKGEMGRLMSRRWLEPEKPEARETRTPEQIIRQVRQHSAAG